jgi:hypothetical protein
VEAVRDVLGGQQPGGLFRGASTDVGFARDQHPLVRSDAVEEPLIVEAGQEVRRTEQVRVVVVVAVEKPRQVEGAAHRDAGREHVGMPQRHRERVVRAEAAASGAECLVAGDVLRERHHLVEEAAFPLQVPHEPFARRPLRVEALTVDGLHAEQAELAGVEFARERPDHAAVFVFEERSHRRREHEHRRAGVPKY